MLPSESYPPLYSSSLSLLSYSVRFENAFRTMLSGVDIETSPPLSFLPSSDLFENSQHYMVYSFLLFSVDFSKTYLHLLLSFSLLSYICTSADFFEIALLCGVLILTLLFSICQKFDLNFGAR